MASINAATAGGGGVITTSDATGNLDIQSGGSTVVAVTSAGAAVTGTLAATGASTFTGTGKFATTIGVGNATPSASGSGITFPATQSASSDANTLDDYEEGTWTPVTTIAGATYTNQVGTYTKIGRQVTVLAYVRWSAHTGSGGSLNIGGLPFAASAAVTYPTGFAQVSTALPAGRNSLYNYILPSQSYISVIAHDSTATVGDASVIIAAAAEVIVTYTYFV